MYTGIEFSTYCIWNTLLLGENGSDLPEEGSGKLYWKGRNFVRTTTPYTHIKESSLWYIYLPLWLEHCLHINAYLFEGPSPTKYSTILSKTDRSLGNIALGKGKGIPEIFPCTGIADTEPTEVEETRATVCEGVSPTIGWAGVWSTG